MDWLQPLINKDDSCYMDVVLNALFLDPSPEIKQVFEDSSPLCVPDNNICGTTSEEATRDIQSTIIKLANELNLHRRGANYYLSLDDIRKSAMACPVLNNPERFDKDGMNDPSVFIEYLVELFPCIRYLNSDKSPLVYLETGPLKKIHGKNLSEVIGEENVIDFEDSELVIFDITRLERGKYNENVRVVPDETLLHDLLELSAVVVWENYHYSVYVNVDGTWYYLDDAEEYVEKVGDYSDLLEHNDEFVSWDGKLFFYTSPS